MAMKILVINDDGITSEGIEILAEFAKTLGEVTVVAPLKEQSGKSHSIDYRNTIKIGKYDFLEGVDAYYVNSTPADCARFAVMGLKKDYDLVLTGINKGFNLGNDILYSGTASSAFEMVARGCKAIAFSTVYDTFSTAKKWLKPIYDYVVKNDLLSVCDVYNVNIPSEPIGIKITRKSGFYYKERFEIAENGEYFQTTDFEHFHGNDLSVDVDACMNGYVSITPMTIDRTNTEAFLKLVSLNDEKNRLE